MTPTFETRPSFRNQWSRLTPSKQEQFRASVFDQLVPALANRQPLPAGLRIKRVQGTKNVYEMTWAPDGRATFEYGGEILEGETHIIWRRIGTHAIFTNP